MTHKALFAAIIIAAAVALAGLLVAAAHPLLYSPVNETPETEFHLNPDVLTAGEVNSTSDVYPIMQDLLDSPGDIVLNIRINDIESAQAALAEYQKTYGTLDHLVIRLDMNQSEIDTFARSAEVQDQIFQQLMNESATLDALQQARDPVPEQRRPRDGYLRQVPGRRTPGPPPRVIQPLLRGECHGHVDQYKTWPGHHKL